MQIDRRTLLLAGLQGAGGLAGERLLGRAPRPAPASAAAGSRPNVLWIVSEDNSPFLGCYGDRVARTPHLDRLASEAVRWSASFASAPVCAPSRFALLTGMYATTSGPAHHMRAEAGRPSWMRGFPELLRGAGYYCTNNAKTDYNADVDLAATWDACSRTAHWRARPRGAPFFSVFNLYQTHESELVPGASEPLPGGVAPASVRIPAYLPDTPTARTDRARYYDQITRMDEQVGALLAQLEADGLAGSTIVFYTSDHGGALPRTKRFCYDSGTRTPLIVRFPAALAGLAPGRPGSVVADPVSSVDIAPTVLGLAGVPVPSHVQGIAFAGPGRRVRTHAFSARDRMDHRYDMVRSVRSRRYRYVRNYQPHIPYGAWQAYAFQQAGYREWERLHRAGGLPRVQSAFWRPKPAEELYDLQTDRDEVVDLVDSPAHAAVLADLRSRLDQHLLATNDNGFIPEGAPLEGYAASRVAGAYPLDRVLRMAATAIARRPADAAVLERGLRDANPVVRLWAAHGCRMARGGLPSAGPDLVRLLSDAWPSVRVAAASALCVSGQPSRGLPALSAVLRDEPSAPSRLQAANALADLGETARPALPALRAATSDPDRLVQVSTTHTVAVLEGRYP